MRTLERRNFIKNLILIKFDFQNILNNSYYYMYDYQLYQAKSLHPDLSSASCLASLRSSFSINSLSRSSSLREWPGLAAKGPH